MKKYNAISIKSIILVSLLSIFNMVYANNSAEPKIITLGPSVTSVVHALGLDKNLVGVDTQSHNFSYAKHVTNVGYIRSLTAEGLLSLRPTLIISSPDASPVLVFSKLKRYGIPVVMIKPVINVADIYDNINLISEALGKKQQGEKMVQVMKSQIKVASQNYKQKQNLPSVLVLLQFDANSLYMLGKNTHASTWLKFIHAKNAVDFRGMRPVSTEGLLSLKPKIILLATTEKQPDFAKIPALDYLIKVTKTKIVPVDINILDKFGADFPCAFIKLSQLIHEGNLHA